jgi:preprotein translocase subunit SecF
MSFAPGAIIALIHDITIPIGIFSLFQLDFSLQILAALMTIVGYSINDTIVIYDRIRENQKLFKHRDLTGIMNTSINQTLNRTILTSLTVLFVTLSLLFFGGPILKDMSLALTIGIISGTYSTVYIASPAVIAFNHYRNKWKKQ